MSYPYGTPASGVNFSDLASSSVSFTPESAVSAIIDNYTPVNKAGMRNSVGRELALLQNFVNLRYLARFSTPINEGYISNISGVNCVISDLKTKTIDLYPIDYENFFNIDDRIPNEKDYPRARLSINSLDFTDGWNYLYTTKTTSLSLEYLRFSNSINQYSSLDMTELSFSSLVGPVGALAKYAIDGITLSGTSVEKGIFKFDASVYSEVTFKGNFLGDGNTIFGTKSNPFGSMATKELLFYCEKNADDDSPPTSRMYQINTDLILEGSSAEYGGTEDTISNIIIKGGISGSSGAPGGNVILQGGQNVGGQGSNGGDVIIKGGSANSPGVVKLLGGAYVTQNPPSVANINMHGTVAMVGLPITTSSVGLANYQVWVDSASQTLRIKLP